MKPVTEEKIREECDHYLKNGADTHQEKHSLKIRTFGNFECFIDGVPAKFQYKKTKELLAYLVDRRGAMVGNGELISILWEGSKNKVPYLKNIKTDLVNVFEDAGFGDAVIKQRGLIGIRTDLIDCDFYDLILERKDMVGSYWGEYMSQYDWGEVTHAYLDNLYQIESKDRKKSG